MPARTICIVVLVFWLALKVQSQERQQSTNKKRNEVAVSLDTNLVILNVTVTDAQDHHVAGLTATDFEILEDRVSQRISTFSFDEMPFAAAILLDTSKSMEAKMSLARAACVRFVERVREGDVVAIYSFGGTKVTMLQDFTESHDVGFALWDTDPDGMTPLYDGIVRAAEALAKRPERRRAILLISDGADTHSRASFDDALHKVVAADILIYAIDLSDNVSGHRTAHDSGAEVMRAFAAKTGGRFFRTPGGQALSDAFTQTVEELRNQYTIIYEPTNERHDGKWRSVEVRLRQPNLKVRTRQGYWAKKRS